MKTNKCPTLLIVEDDMKFRKTLELEFQDRGYAIYSASCLKELHALMIDDLQFAIIDLRLGAENGLSALEFIKTKYPGCRTVMITGYGTISTAVAAMKLGASNYLTKPIDIATLEKSLWIEKSEDTQDTETINHRESLDRHEREFIEYVLVKCNGNISHAAKWLNIHRQSLQRKLRKFPPRMG